MVGTYPCVSFEGLPRESGVCDVRSIGFEVVKSIVYSMVSVPPRTCVLSLDYSCSFDATTRVGQVECILWYIYTDVCLVWAIVVCISRYEALELKSGARMEATSTVERETVCCYSRLYNYTHTHLHFKEMLLLTIIVSLYFLIRELEKLLLLLLVVPRNRVVRRRVVLPICNSPLRHCCMRSAWYFRRQQNENCICVAVGAGGLVLRRFSTFF